MKYTFKRKRLKLGETHNSGCMTITERELALLLRVIELNPYYGVANHPNEGPTVYSIRVVPDEEVI